MARVTITIPSWPGLPQSPLNKAGSSHSTKGPERHRHFTEVAQPVRDGERVSQLEPVIRCLEGVALGPVAPGATRPLLPGSAPATPSHPQQALELPPPCLQHPTPRRSHPAIYRGLI